MVKWNGSILKEIRESQGLSLQDLARLCWQQGFDITPQAINYWERNLVKPTGEHLVALAKVLGVSPDYFLRENPS